LGRGATDAALGVKGCVTNGSFRHIDMLAPGFQIAGGRIGPSHAHVHMVRMKSDVAIFGMLARHGEVIRTDAHGAVVIPARGVRALPKAIGLLARRAKVILDRARATGFTSGNTSEALNQSHEIH
jgi:regulator of RNase E activity RraA